MHHLVGEEFDRPLENIEPPGQTWQLASICYYAVLAGFAAATALPEGETALSFFGDLQTGRFCAGYFLMVIMILKVGGHFWLLQNLTWYFRRVQFEGRPVWHLRILGFTLLQFLVGPLVGLTDFYLNLSLLVLSFQAWVSLIAPEPHRWLWPLPWVAAWAPPFSFMLIHGTRAFGTAAALSLALLQLGCFVADTALGVRPATREYIVGLMSHLAHGAFVLLHALEYRVH